MDALAEGRKKRWPESRKVMLVCAQCGKAFAKTRSYLAGKKNVYCSRACQFSTPTKTRFLAFVTGADRRGCWNWIGQIDQNGYARFKFNNISERAHRAAWVIFKGPIPQKLMVLHRCDNRKCVNPDHLFIGSNSDNMADMKLKRRHVVARPGSLHWKSKLNETQVSTMRTLFSSGVGFAAISRRFNVSPATARKVVMRIGWKHVIP